MPDFDDDDFDFEDVWDILLPLLTNVLIIVLCCWICMKCCKCRRNEGEVLATPAVVITSTQHYPAGRPNQMATPSPPPPSANSSGTGYQQLHQQQKPASIPPMTAMAVASQDPPSYEEAIAGAGHQPAFNPNFSSGQ